MNSVYKLNKLSKDYLRNYDYVASSTPAPSNARPRDFAACFDVSASTLRVTWDYSDKYFAPHPENTSRFEIKIAYQSNGIASIGIIGQEVLSLL